MPPIPFQSTTLAWSPPAMENSLTSKLSVLTEKHFLTSL